MAAMTNKVCRKAELPCLEGRYALNSNACYRKHSHPTFSLGVVEMGRARHYQRRHTEVIGPGAVVATQADIVHSCNPRDERRWSYHMLYVDSEWLAQLAADVGAAHCSHPERSPQLPAVIYDRALYREIISINYQLFSDTPVLDTQTRLVELLGGLLHTHNRRHGRQQPAADHPAVRAAPDYLHDNALRSVSLTELAAVARLDAEKRAARPALWSLVSTGPARASHLTDRGRIEAGRRADLVLVDWPEGGTPAIRRTLSAGRTAYAAAPLGV